MKAEPPIGKSVKITGTIFAPILVTFPLHIHLKLVKGSKGRLEGVGGGGE
jgi:hypothetical protein